MPRTTGSKTRNMTRKTQSRSQSSQFGELETTPTSRHYESPIGKSSSGKSAKQHAESSTSEDSKAQTSSAEFEDGVDNKDLISMCATLGNLRTITDVICSWSDIGSFTKRSSSPSRGATPDLFQYIGNSDRGCFFSSPESGTNALPDTLLLPGQSQDSQAVDFSEHALVDFSETASTVHRSSPTGLSATKKSASSRVVTPDCKSSPNEAGSRAMSVSPSFGVLMGSPSLGMSSPPDKVSNTASNTAKAPGLTNTTDNDGLQCECHSQESSPLSSLGEVTSISSTNGQDHRQSTGKPLHPDCGTAAVSNEAMRRKRKQKAKRCLEFDEETQEVKLASALPESTQKNGNPNSELARQSKATTDKTKQQFRKILTRYVVMETIIVCTKAAEVSRHVMGICDGSISPPLNLDHTVENQVDDHTKTRESWLREKNQGQRQHCPDIGPELGLESAMDVTCSEILSSVEDSPTQNRTTMDCPPSIAAIDSSDDHAAVVEAVLPNLSAGDSIVRPPRDTTSNNNGQLSKPNKQAEEHTPINPTSAADMQTTGYHNHLAASSKSCRIFSVSEQGSPVPFSPTKGETLKASLASMKTSYRNETSVRNQSDGNPRSSGYHHPISHLTSEAGCAKAPHFGEQINNHVTRSVSIHDDRRRGRTTNKQPVTGTPPPPITRKHSHNELVSNVVKSATDLSEDVGYQLHELVDVSSKQPTVVENS